MADAIKPLLAVHNLHFYLFLTTRLEVRLAKPLCVLRAMLTVSVFALGAYGVLWVMLTIHVFASGAYGVLDKNLCT